MDRQLIPLGHRGSIVATICSSQAVSLLMVEISLAQMRKGGGHTPAESRRSKATVERRLSRSKVSCLVVVAVAESTLPRGGRSKLPADHVLIG